MKPEIEPSSKSPKGKYPSSLIEGKKWITTGKRTVQFFNTKIIIGQDQHFIDITNILTFDRRKIYEKSIVLRMSKVSDNDGKNLAHSSNLFSMWAIPIAGALKKFTVSDILLH